MTGPTRSMCERVDPTNISNFSAFLHDILVELGHTVEMRRVTVGEDLSSFDHAIIGCASIISPAGLINNHGTVWAGHQLPHTMYLDDWQIRTHLYPFSRMEGSCSLYRPQLLKFLNKTRLAAALEYKDAIEAQHRRWTMQLPTLIAPLFGWGDLSKFAKWHKNIKRIVSVDPSAFVPQYNPTTVSKARAWVCASLSDQSEFVKKLGLEWPVITQYRPRGMNASWGRIPESEVVQKLYAPNWGVLSPYQGSTSGTGWWRNRFPFARQAGSILLADPREVRGLGGPFIFNPRDIEKMSEQGLWSFSQEQQQWSARFDQPKEIVINRIAEAIR